MKTKVNLGVGPMPIHPQHLEVMKHLDEWILVDKYVVAPRIENWDAENLELLGDKTMEVIYASHLLEHIPHPRVPKVLYHWFRKLQIGGQLIINVPDLNWAARQITKYERGSMLQSDYFGAFNGQKSLQEIIYGTHEHEGERHQSGYTKSSLTELLEEAGFSDITVEATYDAHDMGVLLATAWRRKETKSK